jgi:hypothetical protein
MRPHWAAQESVGAAQGRPLRSNHAHCSLSPGYGHSLTGGRLRERADRPEIRTEQVQREKDSKELGRVAWIRGFRSSRVGRVARYMRLSQERARQLLLLLVPPVQRVQSQVFPRLEMPEVWPGLSPQQAQ